MSGPVDVLVLNDLLRAARFYCDREGAENRSNYANDILERGEKCIAAVAELIEANRVLLGEWDRQDNGNKFDPMPGKDWEAAEARFRAAIASVGSAS